MGIAQPKAAARPGPQGDDIFQEFAAGHVLLPVLERGTRSSYREPTIGRGEDPCQERATPRAARKAGFASPDEIGPYMRTLIDMHRDTMGVAIK